MNKIDRKEYIRTNKYYIILGSICLISLIIVMIYSIGGRTKQYLTEHGRIEKTEITTGYIVKTEKTVEKDQSKVLVPVISEGSKVAKKSIIATYKGEEYKNYEETLASMDKEILERMQELPAEYSSEVTAIEATIFSLVKNSLKETSYNKMQEYKQKINTNINKRAIIIGELSPKGAEIKTLIAKRNKYEEEAKKSNDNIYAPITGIVSYNADGLEEELKLSKINKLSYDKIKELVNTKKEKNSTKIKVVNNYEAYIVIKSKLENLDYMAEGYEYRVRLIENNNYEFIATLERLEQKEDGVEVYFKVSNGIEELVNLRESEVEIVWDSYEGLYVPIETLKKDETTGIYYIWINRYTETKSVPVKVRIQNDSYAVVKNYEAEELEELGIETEYELELYDRVTVIKE